MATTPAQVEKTNAETAEAITRVMAAVPPAALLPPTAPPMGQI